MEAIEQACVIGHALGGDKVAEAEKKVADARIEAIREVTAAKVKAEVKLAKAAEKAVNEVMRAKIVANKKVEKAGVEALEKVADAKKKAANLIIQVEKEYRQEIAKEGGVEFAENERRKRRSQSDAMRRQDGMQR